MRWVLFSVCAALAVSCTSGEPTAIWAPGTVYATPHDANARGFIDRRGLIHAHSIYSHDACDGMPVDKDGVRDQVCFEDFRRGLCQSKHDFVMLTDHRESFAIAEYPDSLLYRAEKGDVLIERGGSPVASISKCPDGSTALILAGSESGFMPVGLERHVAETVEEREAIYNASTPEALQILKDHGAVALVAHTEDYTPEQLSDFDLDGFEMYNLHANTLLSAGNALELIVRLDRGDQDLPHPDLVLLNLISEDPRYLTTWGTVLARGKKRVTTMGTDCHRNTFRQLAQDGERIDSYRRMMSWFSNHLLVRPDASGGFSDLELKDALKSGRLYGAFEVMGYPQGFDYYAEAGGEMGAEVSLASGPVLIAKMPRIQDLDPKAEAPGLSIRILRAMEGGWEEVANGTGDLRYTPDRAGAYRVEVRMIPRHLKTFLGDYAHTLGERDFPWVYSNAIYVR